MKDQTALSSRASIRTVLFTVLLILGGWGIVACLERIYESYHDYRQSLDLAEWSHVTGQLLTAAQHLTFERGRTAVVLRGAELLSASDKAFLDERRNLANASLEAAIVTLKQTEPALAASLLIQKQKIDVIRRLVDRNFLLLRASRDARLPDQWIDTANDLIRAIQLAMEKLVGHFSPGEKATRLTILATSALDLRITAGIEAATIAQAVSAVRPLSAESLANVHWLRGREDRLWSEIERTAGSLGSIHLQDKARKVKAFHLENFRQTQDIYLTNLATENSVAMPLENLTAASLPTLDGISELMTMTTEAAVVEADNGRSRSGTQLVRHILWAVSVVLLLILSLRYVVRKIVEPIERVDRELQRLGALPQSDKRGNEMDHLTASTDKLERILAQRAEAEEMRKETIQELQNAIEQIKTLKGFLPICASCKKIRDDKGYWKQVEEYLTKHTEARFTHGICPDCADKMYTDFKNP